MVMERTEGEELVLKESDSCAGDSDGVNPPLPDEERSSIASSTFADALREKVSIVRKETAGDVMVSSVRNRFRPINISLTLVLIYVYAVPLRRRLRGVFL